jgi:hypothetical protein
MAMPKKSQSITVTVRLRRMHDYWGTPIPWHYSRDALIRCLRGIASRRDNVLQRSCVLLRGQAQVMTHIAIDHVQEGACQLVFKTRIRFAEAKPLVLCLIVAKDSGRVSRLADGEHRNLVALHARRPESVVLPLRGGYLGLEPSRGAPRKIYAYCADWLSGFHELGVNRRMNFFINEKPFHHFDRATTVKIKKQIVDLCMALYDEDRGRGIETPLIGAGDIVITRPRGGRGLELKLIAARKMISGLTREACLKMYKDYRGEWGGKTFRLSN